MINKLWYFKIFFFFLFPIDRTLAQGTRLQKNKNTRSIHVND